MKLSENHYLSMIFVVAIGIMLGVINYFGLEKIREIAPQLVGWSLLVVSIFSFFGLSVGIIVYRYFSPQLFFFALLTFVLGFLSFVIPPYMENRQLQYDLHHECELLGGEITYEKEGNFCRKEYESCGPDENRPGFTICEKKFKRVQPEAN